MSRDKGLAPYSRDGFRSLAAAIILSALNDLKSLRFTLNDFKTGSYVKKIYLKTSSIRFLKSETCEFYCEFLSIDFYSIQKEIRGYVMEIDYIGEYIKYLEQRDIEREIKGNLDNKDLTFDEFKREHWGENQ